MSGSMRVGGKKMVFLGLHAMCQGKPPITCPSMWRSSGGLVLCCESFAVKLFSSRRFSFFQDGFPGFSMGFSRVSMLFSRVFQSFSMLFKRNLKGGGMDRSKFFIRQTFSVAFNGTFLTCQQLIEPRGF